ncbi:MAG TPA: DUF4230 domain-containing protein [Pelolinea sp.]|nr:DUF4230 domain-containing protein [Pelolinea sp.]
MSKNWLVFVIFVSLAVFSLGGFLFLRSFATNALEPISDASNRISTQAAQLFHPTPTILPDPVTIINQVRPLARLETIQYSVEKIITAETGQEVFGALFGDRLLFVAHGVVIAGVDLSKLAEKDISVRNGILEIQLPEAEVFIATLDNEKSYVYDRNTGLFRKADQDLETLARQAAEKEIFEAAVNDGILEQAALNAEVFLDRLLNDLGFVEVIFL